MGATVEREIPSTITDGQRIMLLLKRPDFGTARNIAEAVEAAFPDGEASALGAGTVGILIPTQSRSDLVGFIAKIQTIEVEGDLVAGLEAVYRAFRKTSGNERFVRLLSRLPTV